MKGKINNEGNLMILRGKEYDDQVCPYRPDVLGVECGDWCPLFGEPYPHTERANPTNGIDRRMEATGQTALSLCHKTLIFDEFTDEREETNEYI